MGKSLLKNILNLTLLVGVTVIGWLLATISKNANEEVKLVDRLNVVDTTYADSPHAGDGGSTGACGSCSAGGTTCDGGTTGEGEGDSK